MTYNKSSKGLLSTLLLLQRCSAVKLDSNITPSAEQALVQIESAITASHYCLCYQYATVNESMLGFTATAADADL